MPQACPVCGNLPCTCPGNGGHKQIVVKLGKRRALCLHTEWTEKVQFGDELLTIDELIERLFGQMPHFFNSPDDLRQQWADPTTRQALLDQLEQEGFAEEKLEMIRKVLKYDKCDLLDVLEYLAYNTTPMERQQRVKLVMQQMAATHTKEQQLFVAFMLDYYQREGFKELAADNLKKFLSIKYQSPIDGLRKLGMNTTELRQLYLDMQQQLYLSVHLHQHHFNVAGPATFNVSGDYVEQQNISH